MKWILLSFVIGCILASLTGCETGKNSTVSLIRTEHTEFWHNVDQSNTKATLEFQYRCEF